MQQIKKLILILSFIYTSVSFSQKNELIISADRGLFSFDGKSATNNSVIILKDLSNSNSGYTNNPFGTLNGICLGLSLNYKRITIKNTIYGLSFG